MKRLYTLSCALLMVAGLMAQTRPMEAVKAEKYTVQTNRFKDNWFIGASVGGEFYLGEGLGLGNKGKLISPSFEVNAGKWFTPSIGLRVGFGGYQGRGYAGADGGYAYKPVKPGVYRTKWGMLNLHADVMLNLTDMIGGYREDRLYSAIPYLSVGYLRNTSGKDNNLGVGVGLINRFRLNDTWDVNLEARATASHDGINGIRQGYDYEGSVGLLVGVTFRLGRKNWQKGSGISVAEMEEVQRKLRDVYAQNEQLDRQVEGLNRDLAQQKQVLSTTEVAVRETGILEDAMEYTAFFDINKPYLNEKEVVNLGAYANLIKKYPKSRFVITGYADKQTGPAEFNDKLSRQRAEAVYNTLVDKYGVNAGQLTINYKGGVDTMYLDNPKLSRAAVIKLIK